jgi:beta-glucosidase-like glycosyl hydrolase
MQAASDTSAAAETRRQWRRILQLVANLPLFENSLEESFPYLSWIKKEHDFTEHALKEQSTAARNDRPAHSLPVTLQERIIERFETSWPTP